MSDATVRLSRTWSGIGIGAESEQWNIGIDGTVVGSIANKEIVEVSVEPGHQGFGLGKPTMAADIEDVGAAPAGRAAVSGLRGCSAQLRDRA